MNAHSLTSDLKKMKIVLILLTLMQLAYFGIAFTNDELWTKLDYDYKANYVIGVFHLVVMSFFIWYNWKKMPIDKNRKRDNTFMIILLGIIGMWLWMPSEKQIESMITTNNIV